VAKLTLEAVGACVVSHVEAVHCRMLVALIVTPWDLLQVDADRLIQP
jgi:hypothetical protein